MAVHSTANPLRKGGGHLVGFILEEIEAASGLRLEVATAAYEPPERTA